MSLEQEILQFSYWEHFKKAKELAMIFPPEHPQRIELAKEIDKILQKINLLISQ